MGNKLPKLKLPDSEPLQDRYSDGGGNYWNVARLIDDTKDLEPFDCPLAALDLSNETWAGCDLSHLPFHVKKVMDADLRKPIILSWNGAIADGRHRIIKAIVEGKTTIKAVRMTWRPEPCETKEE